MAKQNTAKPTIPFMLRLSPEDKARFIKAAKEDGYRELAAWLRFLAQMRAKKVGC